MKTKKCIYLISLSFIFIISGSLWAQQYSYIPGKKYLLAEKEFLKANRFFSKIEKPDKLKSTT